MNRSLLATRSGLTLLAAILALSAMLVRPVPANAYTAHHLCAAADNLQCTALPHGDTYAGARIVMWWRGVTSSDFVEDYVRAVSGPNAWPFTPGSGNNTAFNGDPVYEFRYQPNTSWCLGVDSANTHHVVLQSCSNGPGRWWVRSGEYYSAAYANVYATNHASGYTIQWLYVNCTSDGCYVWTEPKGLCCEYVWRYE
jgi:hypothetical protein